MYSYVKITLLRSNEVCNAVCFRLCIDLMHITAPVTAEGYDGFHHPRCAEWHYDIVLTELAKYRL